MFVIRNASDIKKIADAITSDSELFGDEVASVISDLSSLWDDAQRFGTTFTRSIPDMWGHTVTVSAIPTTKKDSWSF